MSKEKLVKQLTILAKNTNHDTIISWSIMGITPEHLKFNRFIESKQVLNFYMYNWKMNPVKSENVAMIMF